MSLHRGSEDVEDDDFEAVQRNTEILKSVSARSFNSATWEIEK